MSAEHNKMVVQRFFEEAFNQGNVAVIDELFTSDAIVHLNTEVKFPALDGAKTAILSVRGHNPDLHWTIEEQIAEGDAVATRLTYSGTYQGGNPNLPETAIGKRFTAKSLTLFHLVDGRITEFWFSTDRFNHFQQLGATLTLVASS